MNGELNYYAYKKNKSGVSEKKKRKTDEEYGEYVRQKTKQKPGRETKNKTKVRRKTNRCRYCKREKKKKQNNRKANKSNSQLT